MTRVNCTVSSCEFWGRGNMCHAEEILVKSDLGSDNGKDYSMEFGEELDNLPEAKGSAQTLCQTMRPRDRDSIDSEDFFKDTPGLGLN